MHDELLDLARKVGADAAALLMDRPPAFEIEEKSTAIDIVTQMDKKAETFIVQSILAARPDDVITDRTDQHDLGIETGADHGINCSHVLSHGGQQI